MKDEQVDAGCPTKCARDVNVELYSSWRHCKVSLSPHQEDCKVPNEVGCRPPGGNVGDSRLLQRFGKTRPCGVSVRSTARRRPAVGGLPFALCNPRARQVADRLSAEDKRKRKSRNGTWRNDGAPLPRLPRSLSGICIEVLRKNMRSIGQGGSFRKPPESFQRRARESNPQPVSRHLISNEAASHSLTLPTILFYSKPPHRASRGSRTAILLTCLAKG